VGGYGVFTYVIYSSTPGTSPYYSAVVLTLVNVCVRQSLWVASWTNSNNGYSMWKRHFSHH